MIRLSRSLAAWNTSEFHDVLEEEIRQLDSASLPLQQCLAQSNRVGDGELNPVILNQEEAAGFIRAHVGIFFPGLDAGSCCADDPTPNCEVTEYCELVFKIDAETGEAVVSVLG